MLKWLTPDAYFDSIYDIDLNSLCSQGIEGLIIDLDNTLIPRDKKAVSDELLTWFNDLEERGLRCCVLSNNLNSRGKAISKKINRPVIAMAKKPSRNAFKKALEVLKTHPEKTVVIGDQIFTDVFGGRRMGLKTILVVPLSGKELFTTALVRQFERRLLKRLIKENRLQKNKKVEFGLEARSDENNQSN